MDTDIQILKSIILQLDRENFKTNSTLIDRFLKEHSSDIKFKLVEMWTEYVLQQNGHEKYFSNN